MRKTALATAALAALPLIATGNAAAEDDLPISANLTFVSDYAFRGISQTDQKPALQGGLEYEHDSGFYAGVWGSNVSWLSDEGADKSSLETGLYAGYAGEAGVIGYDFGLYQYYYPGDFSGDWRDNGNRSPQTLEGYASVSWEFLSFTYNHAFTRLFGIPDSRGSQYYELAASYEVMDGLTLDAHYGYSDIRRNDNYADWRLGVTKHYRGFDFGLHYVDTDISSRESLSNSRAIFSVSRDF